MGKRKEYITVLIATLFVIVACTLYAISVHEYRDHYPISIEITTTGGTN